MLDIVVSCSTLFFSRDDDVTSRDDDVTSRDDDAALSTLQRPAESPVIGSFRFVCAAASSSTIISSSSHY
jgi:hypothetical protein